MPERKKLFAFLGVMLAVCAIGAHYLFTPWGFYRATPEPEATLRCNAVQTAENWLGRAEIDGSHAQIIDLYNSYQPLAMGYVVQYTDSWCATFVSTVAIQCALTDIIPTECGCERQIGLFQELGRWEENDNAVPLPGDLIYYDWNQVGFGDCTGWSDHVGMVVGTKWPFVKVIEGNKDDQVSYRILLLGNHSIRGYGKPDYTQKANQQ